MDDWILLVVFFWWFAQSRNVYVVLCFSEYVPLFVKLAQQVVKKYSSEINKHSNEVEKTLPNHSWDTWSETHETCRRSELAQHTHPTHLNFVFNLKSPTLGVCCYEAWQCLLGWPVTGWHSSKRHPHLGCCWWETKNFGNDTDPWHFRWWGTSFPPAFSRLDYILICNSFMWTCLIDTFWWVAWMDKVWRGIETRGRRWTKVVHTPEMKTPDVLWDMKVWPLILEKMRQSCAGEMESTWKYYYIMSPIYTNWVWYEIGWK